MSVDPDGGLLSPVRAGSPVEAATGDGAWLRAMLDVEAALVRAHARLGGVPGAAAAVITEVAGSARIDVVDLARGARGAANPVVGLVAALASAVAVVSPSAAGFVHRGATSQDVFDTALMLVAQRALRLLVDDLDAVAEALGELARVHRDTPMAGRTLGAHAVPTTFGLKAAGWRQLVLDAGVRVRRLLDGGLPVSLGGAAGTLAASVEYGPPGAGAAGYALRLVSAFAGETGLGVPGLPWHALRTPVVDLVGVLAFASGALGKVAVDVVTLSRTEIGELGEPAAAGRGGSSAMPHKRNPVLATMIRSAALQVPVLAAGVTQSMLAEDERSAGVWHAEWQLLRECLRLTGGAAHTAVELVRGLVVRPDRMLANLGLTRGLVVSERVTAVLAPLLGAARAKELVGAAADRAGREGRSLRDVLGELPEVAEVLTPAALDRLLDPAAYTGAAGALVDRALGEGDAAAR